MHNVLMVIRREYRDRVQKKSFWIGTFLFPVIMVALTFAPMALVMMKSSEQKKIAFVDGSGRLGDAFQEGLRKQRLKDGRPEYLAEKLPAGRSLDETRKSLEPRLEAKDLFAIVIAGPDLDAKSNYRVYARNVGDFAVTQHIEAALHDAVVGVRLLESDLSVDRKQLDRLLAPVEVESYQVSREGGASKKGFGEAYLGTFMFVMVLYMSLILYGIAVMRGILEEKTNRVIEVLLGSVSPQQLMTGKIIGIGLVGLTQLGTYVLTAAAIRLFVRAQGIDLGDFSGILEAFTADKLIYFLVYYVLGYFLYTALFAVVGAMCNTEQEAQNLQTPIVMCLVLPLVATIYFVKNPDSTVATAVSLIPLFTPMVMYMRISVLTPPFWQIALSLVLMIAAIWFLFRASAKIFRIGILMYGKRPTIPEVLRWARS